MKHLLILITSIMVFSANAKNSATIKGTINNRLSDSVYINYLTDHFSHQLTRVGIQLDEKGAFETVISFDDTYQEVEFLHGNQATEFIVADGSNLSMQLDASNFDSSLIYTGKGSNLANFSAKHVLEKGLVFDYTAKASTIFSKGKDDFVQQLNAMAEEKAAYANAQTSVPDEFKRYWSNKFVYNNYYFELMYDSIHKNARQNDGTENNIIPDNPPSTMFNDDFFAIPEYKMFISNYVGREFTKYDTTPDDEFRLEDSMMRVMAQKLPYKTAEYSLANILYQKSKMYSLNTLTRLYTSFKTLFPNSEYNNQLENTIAVKSKTSKGSKASDFTVTTIDGKAVKLSDLKGKVVFIDFWASWCSPCIKELPHSKKIAERFANNDNVVFLSISIDKNEKNWRNAVDKYQVPGINGLDGDGWTGNIAKLYNIQSVPSYFLIDQNGNFALDRAIRPSEEEQLIDAIEGLVR